MASGAFALPFWLRGAKSYEEQMARQALALTVFIAVIAAIVFLIMYLLKKLIFG